MAETGPAVRRAAFVSALLTLLARLGDPAQRLFDHDSVQFALGVLHFDLAAHQPHPPGYPLYVGLLKLLAALGVPPLAGMVALSIAAATAGAFCFALVAARLAGSTGSAGDDRAAGAALLAGALYAFNPLLWFYGELPLVYAVEGGLAAVLAWAALAMADGRRRFLVACLLFAAAGGVRPSTLVLLFPLFLWGLWRAWRRGGFLTWRLTLAGAALGTAVCVAWLAPLAVDAGGLGAYREISNQHFATLLPVTSVVHGAGLGALAHNVEVLVKWALQGLLPAAAAVLVSWATAPRRIGGGLRLARSRAGFLAVWALPPVLFFALFHVTKAGYTLIHLPALLAAAVLAAAPALADDRRRLAAVAVASLVGAGLFVFGTDRRDDQPRWLAVVLHEHNRGGLGAYERHLDALLSALDRFPPERTFLAAVELAGSGGAGADGFLYPYHRHLQWYAPDYPLALLVPEQGFAEATAGGRSRFHRVDGVVPVPAGVDRVVFVLARPVGERLPLPPAEVVLSNGTFHVLAVRFDGELAVDEGLRLVGEGAGEASGAEPDTGAAAADGGRR